MRATLLALLIAPFFFLLFISTSFAHELLVSDSLEVQVHISPNDRPIALQLSRIQIEVKDKNKSFDFANCNCLVKVEKFNTTLAEITVLGDGNVSEISYTFANEGDYTLELSGSPKDTTRNNFRPFKLIFNYTVAPVPLASEEDADPNMLNNTDMILLIFSMTILSALVLLSVVVYLRKRSHNLDKNKP